jgi:hypothetical protein
MVKTTFSSKNWRDWDPNWPDLLPGQWPTQRLQPEWDRVQRERLSALAGSLAALAGYEVSR